MTIPKPTLERMVQRAWYFAKGLPVLFMIPTAIRWHKKEDRKAQTEVTPDWKPRPGWWQLYYTAVKDDEGNYQVGAFVDIYGCETQLERGGRTVGTVLTFISSVIALDRYSDYQLFYIALATNAVSSLYEFQRYHRARMAGRREKN